MFRKRNLTMSREYAESIINTVREPLIVLDQDLRVVKAGRSFYEFFKVKPEETVGQLIYDLGNKQWNIPKLRELLETILPQKATFDNYEVEHDFATIGRRTLLLNARQIRRVLGMERIILLAIEDITERRRIEEKLGTSEVRFRRLFESAKDGILILDAQTGTIVDVNPFLIELLGYSHIELKGKKVWELGLLKDVIANQDKFLELQQQGYVRYENLPLETSDGQHISVEFVSNVYLEGHTKVVQCNIRNITERKQAEEALRESESRFRMMVENMTDYAIIMLDTGGHVVSWNAGAERIKGYQADEIVGQQFSRFYPKEDIEHGKPEQELSVAAAEGRIKVEGWRVRKDGSLFMADIVITALRDDEGQLRGFVKVTRNITERKRAEEALQVTKETLEEGQRIAHLGNWEWDAVNDKITGSEEFYRLFDAAPEGIARFSQFVERLHPDDKQRVERDVAAALRQDRLYDTDYRVKLSDNSWRDINAKGRAYTDADGKPVRMAGTCLDITERKRAEESISIKKRIGDIFLVISDDEMFHEVLKVILETTQSPHGVFGYLDETGGLVVPTMTHQIWDKCQVPEKSIRFPRETWGDSSWPRALREKRTVHSNRPSANTPEGHVAIQRHISLPILFQGEPIGLFQVANKVSDYSETDIGTLVMIADYVAPVLSARMKRKKAEDEIKQLNVELESRVVERTVQLETTNKELEAFSYSVSHDLRAPLRSIDGFSRIIVEEYANKLDEEGKRLLNVVRSNTQKMGELITDLLNLSRVTRDEMKAVHVNMSTLANSIYHEVASPDVLKRCSFSIEPLPDAYCDPSLMRQVWRNLISNAIKFTSRQDEQKIEIKGRTEDGTNIYSIKDSGVGFDPRYSHRLFGAFQRLHKAEEFEGTGVGLAVVQRIVHRHGGRVWAEGAIGGGATFHFSLPLKENRYEQ